MPEPERPMTRGAVLFAGGFALLFCWSFFLVFGDRGIRYSDEGYLWYGLLRTLAGEVPLRDFQSYEPGRYYWCKLFAPLFGDGLRGMRGATTAFQMVGLFFALLVASRFAQGRVRLGLCGLLLGLWMFPSHKHFESALAAMVTWFVVRLLERPSTGRVLAAALFAGFTGFFGRNHALYAGLATGLALALVLWKQRELAWRPRLCAWVLGGLAGYAPMWAMFLFVPGFAAAFWRSTRMILEHGANLPYPWLWPWSPEWAGQHGWERAGTAGLVLYFLLPCLALPYGLFQAWRCAPGALATRAATLGATCTGLFYVHHAAVRSHPHHFAECLTPTLLLALGLVAGWSGWRRRTGWVVLALATPLALLSAHPLLKRYLPGERPMRLVPFPVAGETLHIETLHASYLAKLMDFVARNIPRKEPLFIAPNQPGLYAVLGKVSPSWWTYFFWPASAAEQAELIGELERVNWALLVFRPIDDRDELRFRATHPEVFAYLQQNFQGVPSPNLPKDHVFLRRVLAR